MPRGSIAIIPAASTTFVSGVVPYPYRQEADFGYLTGILQHSVAVVQACGNAGACLATLWSCYPMQATVFKQVMHASHRLHCIFLCCRWPGTAQIHSLCSSSKPRGGQYYRSYPPRHMTLSCSWGLQPGQQVQHSNIRRREELVGVRLCHVMSQQPEHCSSFRTCSKPLISIRLWVMRSQNTSSTLCRFGYHLLLGIVQQGTCTEQLCLGSCQLSLSVAGSSMWHAKGME